MGEAMKLYHPTRHAEAILRDGFGETSGTYLTESDRSGVWIFDRPVDKRMGGGADAVMLELEIPEAVALPYETLGAFNYRQFLMPAAILNLFGPPRVLEGE
ncbi:MAG TPA: hypothetical protein VNA65_06760 [Candidatus Dormibacteraeota bacterium]|nr:hypothetical protein [Candidatus Dormibacteraeota bacterium]